ncbi:hypothetical protein DQ238_04535 [Geodermatophilus sp. TF02-6]|uniref:hypothetical protein n=1 Tax=Geodermatophilus sp. TF02-6 TaxID=2250575 RepID=UPI000DEB6034|nr:hypothetical protein [Geodermatophilus sp. TF02-6]RBY82552.1 hypothetical protein DQ238_04535 [Geodermatophilus sp. TF02-6]
MTGAGRRSRWYLGATLAALAAFTTGVAGRPDGGAWAAVYDVVLYNAVFVGAALVCTTAARRARADRVAWWALACAHALGVAGNLVYTLVVARMPEKPFPSVADAFYLAHHLPLYVALVALIRARVARFHAGVRRRGDLRSPAEAGDLGGR